MNRTGVTFKIDFENNGFKLLSFKVVCLIKNYDNNIPKDSFN